MSTWHGITERQRRVIERLGPAVRVFRAADSAADAARAAQESSNNETVVILGSEDARFDATKGAFVELGHLGAEHAGAAQMWWGSKQGWRTPAAARGGAPVIISYYTIATPYEEEARGLVASCRSLGLEHRVVGVPARGAWEKNCAIKAGFVREMWRSLARPVLWVDADARVRRAPELLCGAQADLGVHKAAGWQFASGTVYLGATELAGELLRVWERRCNEDPMTWDQVHLDASWAEISRRAPLETMWLPQSYTRIFDRPEAEDGGGPAVVEHFQASRRLKGAVSGDVSRPFRDFDDATKGARRASRPTDIVFLDDTPPRKAVA